MLNEFSWRRTLDDLARQSGGHANPFTFNLSPGIPPELNGGGVSAHLHTDFLQYPVRLSLDGNQLLFPQHFIGR
jgi:hypothetical protein